MRSWLTTHKHLLQILFVCILITTPFAVARAGVIEDVVYGFIVNVFGGLIISIGAGLLNFAINTFVIGFGAIFESSGIGIAIDGTWVFVRDLMNLTFIFGLVYIGFKMILNSDDSQSRRWLASLIIAAIFINFSLFFTKFVVDISNFVATEILDAAVGQELLQIETEGVLGSGLGSGGDPIPNQIDIAGSFMNQMRLITVFGGNDYRPNKDTNSILHNSSNKEISWGYIFGTAMLLCVAAFVFFSSAFLFIGRTISLIMYMIFSPLLFIGLVFPSLEGKAREHLKKFLSAAFFAPIYAALLYVNMALINSIMGSNGSINLAATMLQDQEDSMTEFGTSIGLFVLVCGLLLATLKVAKSLGVIGADSTIKAQNYLGKNIRGAAAGVPLRMVNRGSEAALNAYDRMGNSRTGRLTRGALAVVGLNSRAVRSGLNAGAKASYSGSETAQQKSDRYKADNKATSAVVKTDKAMSDFNKKGASVEDQAAAIRRMSPEQIAKLYRSGVLKPEMLQFLTDTQLKALGDSGELREDEVYGEVDSVSALREQGTTDRLTEVFKDTAASADDLRKAAEALAVQVRSLTGDRAEAMGVERLTKPAVAINITDSQLETWVKDGKITTAEAEKIKGARKTAQETFVSNGGLHNTSNQNITAADKAENRRSLFSKGPREAGKLPYNVLKTAIDYDPSLVTPEVLRERIDNGYKDPADVQTLITTLNRKIGDVKTTNPAEYRRLYNMWQNGWTNNNRNSVWSSLFPISLIAP